MSQYSLRWETRSFASLTPHELYAILQLRSIVFVLEQKCIFLDADDKDQDSHHLMGWDGRKLAAYCRLLPAGHAFREISIGRVVSSPLYRGTGAGRMLMTKAIQECRRLFGEGPIRIGAQLYLKQFYSSLGFIANGNVYLEDDIEHVEMVLE